MGGGGGVTQYFIRFLGRWEKCFVCHDQKMPNSPLVASFQDSYSGLSKNIAAKVCWVSFPYEYKGTAKNIFLSITGPI